MKNKILFVLLMLFLISPNICFASESDSFESASSESPETGFDDTFESDSFESTSSESLEFGSDGTFFYDEGIERSFVIVNEDNSTITGVADIVVLEDKYLTVPANTNTSIVDAKTCGDSYQLSSTGYDVNTAAAVMVNCGENSTYQFSVTTEDESLVIDSVNGTAVIMGIPLGKFTSHINNTQTTALNCSTTIVATGLDTTPEAGFPISLKCVKKEAPKVIPDAATILKPIASGIIGLVSLLLTII